MKDHSLRMIVAAAMVAGVSGTALAQFPPPPPPPASSPTIRERWPEPPRPKTDEATPKPQAPQATSKRPSEAPAKPAPSAPRAKPQVAADVITCSGVFAKDSSHLKLALKYDSRNITFGPVDATDGTKINASILFPNDPRRRLEVLWTNEAARSDLSVIAINGRSQWVAPKGVKLGLNLAALEKINGRPFKLGGFGADGTASVVSWEGGALAGLPGGCKVGIRLFVDRTVPDPARKAVAGEREFLSNDASVRMVRPAIGEILVGY
jgi:hypothetical protein